MPWTQRARRSLFGSLGSIALSMAIRWTRGKGVEALERKGASLGRLLFRISRKHRRRALANLALAFPEMAATERESLARKVFEHFGIVAVDFVSTESRRPEEVLASIDVEGWDHLKRAIAVGKGVLLLTGHFGNWERFAHYGTLTGVEVSVVARDADHPGLQAKVSKLREAAGMKVLSRGSAARAILGALKQRKVVGLLPDQNSAESFLPYFGRPTGTVLGPAVLHLRTGAPMIPLYCARVGVGRYRILIEPPLEPMPGVENVQEALMASYNASLERIVREHPEQWLWFHDRWKSARQEGLIQ